MIEIKHKATGHVLLQVPDDTLEGADLRGADLAGANLFGQDLYAAQLQGADLSGAELSNSHLTNAELQCARLVGAALDGADLTSAHFEGADLRGADLSNAQLMTTWLAGANLTDVTLSATIFARCFDLHQAIGLDKMRHVSDCILDRSTLYEHIRQLPDIFLVGVGYHPDELKELRDIYGPPLPYYSCFISYRRIAPDIEFAIDRLYTDLKAHDVRCWIDSVDMQGGKFYPTQLSLAIKEHEKVILVCSKDSLLSQNVVDEIITALHREREMNCRKLFPITLDDFITGPEILAIADQKMVMQEWSLDWVRQVRDYHIPDFSRWRDVQTYQVAFEQLLRDLKKPTSSS